MYWICEKCGDSEDNHWDVMNHVCIDRTPVCDKCWLTKPCECDDD